jgi:hypothetical protein
MNAWICVQRSGYSSIVTVDHAVGFELPYYQSQLNIASGLGHGVEGALPGEARFAIRV